MACVPSDRLWKCWENKHLLRSHANGLFFAQIAFSSEFSNGLVIRNEAECHARFEVLHQWQPFQDAGLLRLGGVLSVDESFARTSSDKFSKGLVKRSEKQCKERYEFLVKGEVVLKTLCFFCDCYYVYWWEGLTQKEYIYLPRGLGDWGLTVFTRTVFQKLSSTLTQRMPQFCEKGMICWNRSEKSLQGHRNNWKFAEICRKSMEDHGSSWNLVEFSVFVTNYHPWPGDVSELLEFSLLFLY